MFKKTWVLAAVTVALGAYIYFFEIKKSEKDAELKAQSEKVYSFDSGEIVKMEFKNSTGEFELNKANSGGWSVKGPISDTADDSAVTSFLTSILAEKYDDVGAEENTDLKVFGLQSPVSNLTLTTKSGQTVTISTGSDAAISGKSYVQKKGDKKVMLVGTGFKMQLNKPAKDFLEKRIFRLSAADVYGLELKVDKKDLKTDITLVKKDGFWVITKPIQEKADKALMETFTGQIENLRATDFLPEKGDLKNSEVTVVLRGKDNKVLSTLHLTTRKKDNNVIASGTGLPSQLVVFAGALQPFEKKIDEFRDHRGMFEVKKDDINEFMYKNSLVEVHLKKNGLNWELANKDPKVDVSQIHVTNFLNTITNLSAAEFLTKDAKSGLERPKGTVVLKDVKGAELLKITWGEKSKSGKTYYTTTSKDNRVYGVDTGILDNLPGQTLLEDKKEAPVGINQATAHESNDKSGQK